MDELMKLWEQFENVPVDLEGEILEPFLHFEAGTDVTDVWLWFEEQDPRFRVAELV